MVAKAAKGSAVVTLPSDTEILITREFDAPRHLIYQAWTTPELIKRWWSANRGQVTKAEVDLRVGGKWRWGMTAQNGYAFEFYGEYREIIPNERLVHTETFSGAPDAPALTTLTLTERDGRTTATILVQHQRKEHRDAHINSGMEGGMQEAMDMLEEVARSL